jgi:hypothetical protein
MLVVTQNISLVAAATGAGARRVAVWRGVRVRLDDEPSVVHAAAAASAMHDAAAAAAATAGASARSIAVWHGVCAF